MSTPASLIVRVRASETDTEHWLLGRCNGNGRPGELGMELKGIHWNNGIAAKKLVSGGELRYVAGSDADYFDENDTFPIRFETEDEALNAAIKAKEFYTYIFTGANWQIVDQTTRQYKTIRKPKSK